MNRLNEIEARLNAATPGQWWIEGAEYDCGFPCTPDGCLGHYSKVKSILHGPEGNEDDLDFKREEDARFIANAPTDIRWLLDENARMRERAQAALECLVDMGNETAAAECIRHILGDFSGIASYFQRAEGDA